MLKSVGVKLPFAAIVMAAAGFLAPCSDALEDPAADKVLNFRLIDQDDRSHELYRLSGSKAIALISFGIGCPIIEHSIPEILALRARYEPLGARFLLIDAFPQDTRADLARAAEELRLDIPILKDHAQLVSRSLGIERTAEARVIDPSTWRIVYRGPIDDASDYGHRRRRASHPYLAQALDALLNKEEGRVPRSRDAKGCLIAYAPRKRPSYADAAPILRRKCASCHDGRSGAWAMTGFETVKGWLPMIRETLMTGRMPPWHADPAHGAFEGDPSLDREELLTLVDWIDSGAPRGTGPDPLREPLSSAGGWKLGSPDLTLRARERIALPLQPASSYRYFRLGESGSEDRWVRATELRPDDPKSVHHMVVFAGPSSAPAAAMGFDHIVGSWSPGKEAMTFPAGTANLVPKGSTLILQVHDSPSAARKSSEIEVGLYFDRGRPKKLEKLALVQRALDIPPGASEHAVFAQASIERAAAVRAFFGHMHFRGARMRLTAAAAGERSKTLISIPHYDMNWQRLYSFKEPQPFPAGTRFTLEGAFDNSAANPRNPDPSRRVVWGFESDDEMFVGLVFYTAD